MAPIGSIVIWPTATAPAGWLLCNGMNYNTTTYPALYAVIGYTYGRFPDLPTDLFLVPNLMGKFPLGAGTTGTSATPRGLATVGGDDRSSLTSANMLPPHVHGSTNLTTNSAGGHQHGINRRNAAGTVGGVSMGQGANNTDDLTVSNGAHTHNVTGQTDDGVGTSAPFNTIPPYLALNFIIRAV
jgi:microcystin-dependent protein